MWWRPASWSPPATSSKRERAEGGPQSGGPPSLLPRRPTLAFGGWGVGGKGWGGAADEAAAVETVRRAFDRGIRLFDTAPTYGGSEAVIGRALAGHREEAVLATKVGPRDDPAASLEASLRRLGTDRVDLLQLHEVGERFEWSLEVMLRLRDEGKALHLGLSNAAPAHVHRAIDAAGIEAYQGPYNLVDRDVEQRILPLCRESGLAFLAYRPLASGVLSGSFGPAPPSLAPGDHRAGIYWFKGREYERRRAVVDGLRPLARHRGMSLPALALAWVLSRPGVTAALAGARTPEQVDENVAAVERPLDPEEVRQIDAVVAGVFRPPTSTARARRIARGWGERERFIVERLDGTTSYEAIAAAWAEGHEAPMIAAQVKLFADDLLARGLATGSGPAGGGMLPRDEPEGP